MKTIFVSLKMPVFKGLFVTLALFLAFNLYSQKVMLSPHIGLRNHFEGPLWIDRGGISERIMNSPVFGFELDLTNLPVSITVEKDFNFVFTSQTNNRLWPQLVERYDQTSIFLEYNLNEKYSIILGYYSMLQENLLNFGFQNKSTNYQGIITGFNYNYKWLDIAFQAKLNIYPSLEVLADKSLYSVAFRHRIFQNEEEDNIDNALKLKPLVGLRFFPIVDQTTFPAERFPPLGIAPTLGLELFYEKINMSLILSKDIWVSLNAGSSIRDIKGLIVSKFIGVSYSIQFNNDNFLKLGIGYSYIRDLNNRMALEGIPASDPRKLEFTNYQVKGVGALISYKIFTSYLIEVKHTFPVSSLDEPFFNPSRLSVGVIYNGMHEN
jgi:hypothetical protein